MRAAMLGLLAETPIHPGAGRGMGVVDLPVAREAATDYPVLVGSSLKGALRDKADDSSSDERFGRPDHAGDLLVSDARLLLLPVRSLTGAYRWTTCPHLIERYVRDCARSGRQTESLASLDVDKGKVLANGSGDLLFLEERQFTIQEPAPGLKAIIAPLLLHEETRNRLDEQIAVLNDDDFAWFVRYGLSVQARNVLDKDGSKRSKNLWYEETLPPDTVLYAVITGRSNTALDTLDSIFPDSDPYLQAGGNETVGQGWFAVSVLKPAAKNGENSQ